MVDKEEMGQALSYRDQSNMKNEREITTNGKKWRAGMRRKVRHK